MIPNCHVTRQDILRAEDIFGPNVRSIKGKMTYTKQKHVQVDLQDIPQGIMEKHSEVTLAIDVMFIKKIPFIMTTLWDHRTGERHEKQYTNNIN